MNFFEQELQKIVGRHKRIANPIYVGGACYGQLGGDLRLKLQFTTLGTARKYEGIKATILNRRDGPVDQTVFRFSDVLGSKQVPNPNFPQGITPYAWTYDGNTDWYGYHPDQQDYQRLFSEIDTYCSVFLPPVMEPEQTMEENIELTMEGF